jgi:molybdopterin converting factor small subunit
MTIVRIPTPLRPFTQGLREVEVDGETVGTLIEAVALQYPLIKPHLFDDIGDLRSYVNLFLNDEDIRHLDGYDTPVEQSDRLMIVPSIAGGSVEDETLKLVDHAALRTNQATIIVLLIISFVLDKPALALLVGLAMLLGTIFQKPGFLPVYRALKKVGMVNPEILGDNVEPHQFAQGFGAAVLLLSYATNSMGVHLLSWILVWVVIVLAGVNLFLGFCVGCAVYYWLNRLGLPFFRRQAPADRIPGTRPPKGDRA